MQDNSEHLQASRDGKDSVVPWRGVRSIIGWCFRQASGDSGFCLTEDGWAGCSAHRHHLLTEPKHPAEAAGYTAMVSSESQAPPPGKS